jgi:hypothetical protein
MSNINHLAAAGLSKLSKMDQKLAKWVRSLGINAPRVQPNHGRRHRFTTVARSVSMDHEKRLHILGQALQGMGGVYGDMARLYNEVVKLPRYEVKETSQQS